MDTGNRWYIIPTEVSQHTTLLRIDRNTKEDVRLVYGIHLLNDWEANTIATQHIETLIAMLGLFAKEGILTEFNFYDMLMLSSTNRVAVDAEKEGNLNISFSAGSAVEALITENIPRQNREYEQRSRVEDFVDRKDASRQAMLKRSIKNTQLELQTKYTIGVENDSLTRDEPDEFKGPWAIAAIAYIFLENIYRELLYMLANDENSQHEAFINFNDIIELHAIRSQKDDGVKILLRPGYGAKLAIKSDATTERDG